MRTVLVIEDNLADQRLAIEAFRNGRLHCHIDTTADGLEALRRLAEPNREGKPLPDLILLDLNLPRIDGRQILRAIKSVPALCHIPVLVLSSSNNPADIAECYQLQANCYLIKPIDIDSFFEMIQKIEDLWMDPSGAQGHFAERGCRSSVTHAATA